MMIDITVPLKKGMDVWEGDPEFESELVYTVDNDGANVSKLILSAHAGTHIDAGWHYFNDKKGVDEIDIDTLIGKCQVICIDDEELEERKITVKSIMDKIASDRVLFKTSNSNNPGVFQKDAVALSLEAAQYLNQKGVKLVGIDGFSVENFYGDGTVHKELLSHDVVVVETLDLSHVEPGTYELMCFPMKIIHGDAAPTRAVLRTI